ncbi:Functional role page for Anaerobic nitric oxide reductase transcription regulator NorR [Myxococcus hansupus]|uniref:Functional role page for Anaerobic nitric oxide reductase transcription regulator NorR n=1 Tax=Pseudomyxococcus hansupus TaxID=1297742 RepID=A0A0H4WZ55_9BACT|nr:sigma-54 dependent transcriptional regulator [Myxococcus hansupus]AKQ66908.1 Functional role page for Anaerobic nitric oxide reductase transcription regulator NorR [Myxococcus hansupus]
MRREQAPADATTEESPLQREPKPHAERIPALTLFAHPRPQRVGERFLMEALTTGRVVELSRNAPDFTQPRAGLGGPLADPFLSRKPLRFIPGPSGSLHLDPGEGSQVIVSGVPLVSAREFSAQEVSAGIVLELGGRVGLVLHQTEPGGGADRDALTMVGTSLGLQRVRQRIAQVAPLGVPVLIRGETGAGKELIARAVHERSARRNQPFISVNLAAVPKELAASELFGARKGAFTGAVRDQKGLFVAANGGTLFLDEVGEAPPEVQVMLLRVLETGECYPVGSHSPVKVDVRLLAATDARLEAHIEDGRFKAPLLHRLAGYVIQVPPLRERREDIGLLFHHFAHEELRALGAEHRLTVTDAQAEPWLPVGLASRLVRHGWPGNIRQLRNVTRRLMIDHQDKPCLHLDPELERELDSTSVASESGPPLVPTTLQVKRRKASGITEEELTTALRECAWDLNPTADKLGIARASLYDLIQRFPNIRTAGRLSEAEIARCHQECQGDLEEMARRLEVSRKALARRVKELGL